ncbi:hypothetical protein Tco_0209503 [Tanacetum coccineum]
MQLIKLHRASVPFDGHLKEYGYDEKEVLKGLKKVQVYLVESFTSLKRLLKEKTRIKEEIKATMNEHYLAIIKDDLPPKEKDPGSLDFLVLDMPEDIKISLILGRPFLSTAHDKIDVFQRKIALKIRNNKIVFKNDSPTSNIIKKVYVLGLRE